MKKSLVWLVFLCCVAFTQDDCDEEKDVAKAIYDSCVNMDRETDDYAECAEDYKNQKIRVEQACRVVPTPVKPKAASPRAATKPVVSLPQALKSSGLSSVCVDDFADILGERGFSMTNFAKELVPEVAKVKLKMKSPFPFGKPKDNDLTSVGLSVGCIKALPESPAEIQSLLKNISLKAGLNFAAGTMDDYSIPSNVGKKGGSGDGAFKTIMSSLFIAGGLGAIVYGFTQDSEVKDAVKNWEGKAAVDAEKKRNIGYGIGAGLLAGGLGVVIFF